MSTLLNPDDVKWIILHCSASHYGDADTFDAWHKDRGWNGIGYHWVICNCYPKYENYINKQPDITYDGVVQKGRSEQFRGAHVSDHNWESVGIVLVGAGGEFSSRQLLAAVRLCRDISLRFPRIQDIKGHNEFTNLKTCPEIDMAFFRKWILPLGVNSDEGIS
jgi:hypothetical protein